MRLQADAARQSGRVVVVIGNHDVQLLAARRFGEPFTTSWLEAGGVPRDLDEMGEAHAAWLANLPAIVVEQEVVLLHADAMFYLDYGSSASEINAGFRHVLSRDDPAAWQRLLDQFGEHRAFSGPNGEAHLQSYLRTFGARQLVHGHTPVPRILQVAPESVNAAYVYCDGRCVNVDPGLYLGGPGFAFRVTLSPTIGQ
jgi:Calcineurin-like phosphoesterase